MPLIDSLGWDQTGPSDDQEKTVARTTHTHNTIKKKGTKKRAKIKTKQKKNKEREGRRARHNFSYPSNPKEQKTIYYFLPSSTSAKYDMRQVSRQADPTINNIVIQSIFGTLIKMRNQVAHVVIFIKDRIRKRIEQVEEKKKTPLRQNKNIDTKIYRFFLIDGVSKKKQNKQRYF